MTRLITAFTAMLLLFYHAVFASTPQELLTTFFQQRLAGVADQVTVTMKSPASQWPDCERPLFHLTGNSKNWGELSVVVTCNQIKRFIRVSVQAKGNYLVAGSAITRGEALNAGNVQVRHGLLNVLPAQTLLSLSQIQDAVALRDLPAGQPLQRSWLRQAWRVRAGQQVQVIINGAGFRASSTGKALNNAALSQAVRVRMPSGQIINGIADSNGNVLISD